MDLDAFVSVHAAEWTRLDALSRRRRLTADEADELVDLYRRSATHLSVLRSSTADGHVVARLTMSVAQARSAVAGTGIPLGREVVRFVTVSFPAAAWRSRWWVAFSTAFFLVVAVVTGLWIGTTPAAYRALGDEADLHDFAYQKFENYYSEYSSGGFGAHVWTNNSLAAAMAVALGITGIGVLWVLLSNALNIGVAAAILAHYDRLGLFFQLILPHGLLELTAIFTAAGAGLRLFWGWVSPGSRTRAAALAEEGRAMITVALGLVGVLFVSGVLESVLTPSGLPAGVKIAIGALVWASYLAYVAVFGRRAVAAGETGDLDAALAGDIERVA